jgi:6-phosphogluconate dehydrogenase
MEIGLVGLGRMGGNMRERLRRGGHTVVGYDRNPHISDVTGLDQMAERLAAPRVVWVMVPAGPPTAETIASLTEYLSAGDVVRRWRRNSRWTDDSACRGLGTHGIGFVDAGVSGGIWGLECRLRAHGGWRGRARCTRAAGARHAQARGVHMASCTLAKAGAGHFAKMVHNGIEYGLMQAYAEGIRAHGCRCRRARSGDLQGPGVKATVIVRGCSNCSIAHSTRMPTCPGSAVCEDSGEGRWTVEAAIDHAVPVAGDLVRAVREIHLPPGGLAGNEVVSALRNQFGGHAVTARPPTHLQRAQPGSFRHRR